MGSEADSTLRLPLFVKPHSESIYYFQESPLHTSATVPFLWEEEPGKPRKCNSSHSKPMQDYKCLDLPPRLLLLDANGNKLPSPTTVLGGPYINGKWRFKSSSFRIIRKDCFFGSFRKSCLGPEGVLFGSMGVKRGFKEKGLFGSFGLGGSNQGREQFGGYTYGFASFMDGEVDDGDDEKGLKSTRSRRAGGFTALSRKTRSHFWATIYEGLKQVIPWTSKKLKKTRL